MDDRGRILAEDLDMLRQKVAIADVAADHFTVRRSGRRLVARCPFHDEKTASFSIDPANNLFYCFGCGEGGDVFTLVQKLEHLDFSEAAERLASRFGVTLRYEERSPKQREESKRRSRWHELLAAASDFFHDRLRNDADANPARAYLLNERKFDRDTLSEFKVGYSASGWTDLVKHLRASGFKDDEMVEVNVAMRRDDGSLIDRFRERVMFPIWDARGQTIGFGARRMRDDQGPKYINTSETPLYKKTHVLYGLDRAKQSIVKNQTALLVEGYTDVMALHAAGLKAAVATCGTALTAEHLKTLGRFAETLIVCMDGDDAGGAAAERLFDQLGQVAKDAGLALRVVAMPRGHDPADLAAEDVEKLKGLLDSSESLVEFVLSRESSRFRTSDGQQKARALQAGLKHLVRETDPVVQRDAARRFADQISVDVDVVFVELDRFRKGGAGAVSSAENVIKRSSAQVRRERDLLGLVANNSELVAKGIEGKAPEDLFSLPEHREAWRHLWEGTDPEQIEDADVKRVVLAATVGAFVGPRESAQRLCDEIVGRLMGAALGRKVELAKAELERMKPDDDPVAYDAVWTELLRLEAERRRLETTGEDFGPEDA